MIYKCIGSINILKYFQFYRKKSFKPQNVLKTAVFIIQLHFKILNRTLNISIFIGCQVEEANAGAMMVKESYLNKPSSCVDHYHHHRWCYDKIPPNLIVVTTFDNDNDDDEQNDLMIICRWMR